MPTLTESEFNGLRDEIRETWLSRSLSDIDARRAEVGARVDQLRSYVHRSGPQADELDRASAEVVFLDELAGEKRAEISRAKLDRVAEIYRTRPDLCESGDGGQAPGSPALVSRLGTRHESAAEVIAARWESMAA